MHDQISSDERSKHMMRLCSMHSIFLSVKVQICAGHIYLPCMLDSNMEIRIVGSYGCLQLSFNMKSKYIDLSFLTGR